MILVNLFIKRFRSAFKHYTMVLIFRSSSVIKIILLLLLKHWDISPLTIIPLWYHLRALKARTRPMWRALAKLCRRVWHCSELLFHYCLLVTLWYLSLLSKYYILAFTSGFVRPFRWIQCDDFVLELLRLGCSEF